MNRLRILLLGMLVFLLVACGNNGGDDPAGDAPPEVNNVDISCAEVEIADSDDDVPNLNGCTLRIAVGNDYSPFSFVDTSDSNNTGENLIGYDHDIFAEICDLLNCEPEFVEVSWEGMVEAIESRDFSEFDVGANGIVITDERLRYIDFSDPYISLSQVLLVRAGEDRFTQASQLAVDTALFLGSQPGTRNYDNAVELVGEKRVRGYGEFGAAVQALTVGYVDAVLMDEVMGSGYERTNPDAVKQVELSSELLKDEELGFIFAKEGSLIDAVNSALAEMSDNGKLDELFETWFSTETE